MSSEPSSGDELGKGTVGQGRDYHRLESPTQTPQDAIAQVTSGEVWGRPSRNSVIPAVKAYRHRLPSSARGIDFHTTVSPTPGSGTPYEARWYHGQGDPEIKLRPGTPGDPDFAAIRAKVTNKQL